MSDAMSDTERYTEAVFQSVKVYVDRKFAAELKAATKPLLERLAIAEKTLLDSSAADNIVKAANLVQRVLVVEEALLTTPKPLSTDEVKAAVAEAVAAIEVPPGEPGAPGEKGADAVIDQSLIDAAVEKAIAAIEIVVPEPIPGPKGEAGEKGADGKDAVINPDLVAAEVEKQIKAIEIVVPDPIPGKDGAPGKDGSNGADAVVDYVGITKELTDAFKGICGMLVEDAIGREQIPELVAKAFAEIPKPSDGRDGRDGLKGDAGRDAAELVVLSAIDPERIYAMGTWARHRGGLWQAKRDTDELKENAATDAGWACIVEGFANLSLADSDEEGRTITLAAELSSGRKSLHTIETGVMVDRGVYQPGKEYAKGDVVSFAGSMLIAQRKTSAMPETPGAKDDWRLAVKRGRDGKDAEGKPVGKRDPVRL